MISPKGYYKGINPLDKGILTLQNQASKIPFSMRNRVFWAFQAKNSLFEAFQRVNTAKAMRKRVKGTKGYFKGINPFGKHKGKGYPPLRGYL